MCRWSLRPPLWAWLLILLQLATLAAVLSIDASPVVRIAWPR